MLLTIDKPRLNIMRNSIFDCKLFQIGKSQTENVKRQCFVLQIQHFLKIRTVSILLVNENNYFVLLSLTKQLLP